ncbi:MAG: glycosyltransferase [Fimbriimonadaceae bacterium]|nr:glycosyltransferase [Fimbriimonadaceae bacterium]
MHILRLAFRLPPCPGGEERHVWELSREQGAAGHQVTLLHVHGEDPGLPGVTAVRLDPRPARSDALADWFFGQAAQRWLRAQPRAAWPQLVHAHGDWPLAWHAAALGGRFGAPTMVTLHGGLGADHWLRHGLRRVAFNRVDQVFSVSAHNADRLRRLGVVTPIQNQHSGTLVERLRALPYQPAARPRLLAVGRLDPVKGFDVLIAAARRLVAEFGDLEVLIAGDGPERDRLSVLAADLPQVRLLGEQTRQQVYELLRSSWLFCSTSVDLPWISEGLPTTIIEALGAELPVVASAVGGCGEVVRDGLNGRLVPPGDAAALATAVAELLRDAALRADLRAGASASGARCDWSQVAAVFSGVGQQLLAARGPAAPPRLVTVGKARSELDLTADPLNGPTWLALAARGVAVELVTVSAAAAGHCQALPAIRVHGLPPTPGWRGHVDFLRRGRRLCATLARAWRPTAFWASDPLDGGLVAWLAARAARRPFVLHLQGDFFRLSPTRWNGPIRWGMGRLAAFLARRAARVRVLTQAQVADLTSRGVPAERVVVIPPRTDMSLYEPARWAAERQPRRAAWGWTEQRVLLFVGALNPSKGLDLLLTAAAELRPDAPDLRYVLVGGGPLEPWLRAEVARLGLDDCVLLAGPVPYDELPGWLAAADGLIAPSRDEGLARSAVQAAAMERPVIVTTVGGNADLVNPGETGWLVAPTVPAIRAALAEYAALDAATLAAMGRAGRPLVVGRFGFEANIALLDELLVQPFVVR